MVKVLKTRDSVLNKEQIKESLAKIAASNSIAKKSSSSTYPIPRVKENLNYISLVYNLLSEHVKLDIPIHPAGEWLLDNFYLLEKSVKTVSKELTKNKYARLPGLENNGFARIFVLANEIVSNTDGKIKKDELTEYLEAYQTQKNLSMEEIWNVGTFVQICLIEKIRNVCEKIFIAQIQKHKALNIVERLIENKPNKKIKIETTVDYPFVEFMSYKLKKYGKAGVPYLDALEDEVRKSGMTVLDVINREHFDIAVRTLSMKNCITSIKEISRMDIIEIFEKINITEKLLKQDPAGVYKKMDYKTKSYYRDKILELSKKTKVSEIFIAEQILSLCNENMLKSESNPKKAHVGYYLIDEGKQELLSKVLNKKVHVASYDEKAKQYIFIIYFLSCLITLLLTKLINVWAFLLFIPIQNAVTQIAQYILTKTKRTRLVPKLDLREGIPEEFATMCIIPTILTSEQDVQKIVKNMEVYYLANKSDNLFFTLLGDCTSSEKEQEKFDKKIIDEGISLTKELNEKYGEIFYFAYRKREWSHGEKCFMGWERKRGLINQYNEFLKTGKSCFLANSCERPPKVKYVITLDSDTNLTLNSVSQLVGAMGHILNKPEVDKIKNLVVKGHAIIQPRVGLNIYDGRKTTFSRLFAGNGGTDLYSSAISDIYQDNFDEGIFTGKGIYDLDVFYDVLKDSIPENTVLSHDLLEGSYLRCALASDIVLMDGYPSKYSSYKLRKHRWIRGDVQILRWLKSRLNALSKYKIIDNIVRNKNEEYVLLSMGILAIFYHKYLLLPLAIYAVPTIIRLMDNLINQRDGVIKHKLFVSSFSKWTHTCYKFLVELAIIPDIAFLEINAFCKAFYRMKISHAKLLEWTTAEEAEKTLKDDYKSYFKGMFGESMLAVVLIIYTLINYNKFSKLNLSILIALSILWLFSSVLMWGLSLKNKKHSKLAGRDEKYLLEISKKTWKYFKDNLVNYLPADNYQEDRTPKQALRTSPTNIGLAMLSIIASYDLGFENVEDTIGLLNSMLDTVQKLQKWNGHLYNWYDIETLEPIIPHDISSVDSGNFVGYLYTVKQFLKEHEEIEQANNMIIAIDKIIAQTDFEKLYNHENGLFSIGFSIQDNKLYDSYYDLLASEARQTSIIAIAKKDVPAKHWSNLGRTLTRLREHKGLVSWGGTAFEYLMPNINIPTYPSTLLDESCKLLVLSDKEYAGKLDIPWGMSEAAFSLKDFKGNYQYKTFGISWLGLKRGLEDEAVVSPYSSALALNIDRKDAIQNLRRLEKEGLVGEYGFYDSVDYKPKREVVKTYMAHHQGMILTSIDNAINENIFQKRFMENPEMQGVKILLQENMPEDVIITKEKKTKAKKIKYDGYEQSAPRTNGVNLISSNSLSNVVDDKAKGFTKLDDILINKGVDIYIKNISSNKVYDFNRIIKDKELNLNLAFTPYNSKLEVEDGNIKVEEKIAIAANSEVEIRKITIANKGINEANLELTTYEEPVLSTLRDHNAHPTFDKMFLRYEVDDLSLIVSRKSRSRFEKPPYLATTLYSEEGTLEFEIDKEKFVSRGNTLVPDAVENSKPLSCKIDTVINPIIAFKKAVRVKAGEKKEFFLISSVGYNKAKAKEELNKYCSAETLDRVFDLAKAQTEAEIRYMGITEKDVTVYSKMLKYLLYSKQEAFDKLKENELALRDVDLSNKNLWTHGISGDYPLIVCKLKEQNDLDSIKEVLNSYEYFLSKNVRCELVILSTPEIKEQIISDKISKYLNQRGGIFVLDNLTYEESKIIEARANLLLNAKKR